MTPLGRPLSGVVPVAAVLAGLERHGARAEEALRAVELRPGPLLAVVAGGPPPAR